MRRFLHWLLRGAPSAPETFIDITGVEMKYRDTDCLWCGAPGMECVNPPRCPRSGWHAYADWATFHGKHDE